MSFSNFLENELLDHAFRNAAYTPPTAVYAALFTSDPGEAGGGTEVSGGSYARQPITFGAASGGAISNTVAVTFPVATADWGTITHFAVYDAASGGNIMGSNAVNQSKVVSAGDTAAFAIGDLDISLD